MKIKLIVSIFLIGLSQFVSADIGNDIHKIDSFIESLSICGKALSLKVPNNMVLSDTSSEEDGSSILVFKSYGDQENTVTFRKEPHSLEMDLYASTVHSLADQNKDVKEHGRRVKHKKGKYGQYRIERATLSYCDEGITKAMSFIVMTDAEKHVSVVVESENISASKAVSQARKLAKKALSIQVKEHGVSEFFHGLNNAYSFLRTGYYLSHFFHYR